MPSVAELIRAHHAEILELWRRAAQRAAAAKGLDRPELQNMMSVYLLSLADAGDELGQFKGKRREWAESHLSYRLRQGFGLAEIVEDFAVLGRCIAAMWNKGRGVEPPDHADVENLFEELHLTSAAVTQMFTRHMMEDEQVEKQFLRLIQTVASEALEENAPALEARLKDVLDLVMEAVGAQNAALLLYDPVTQNPEVTASAGTVDGELERHFRSFDASLFAGQLAEDGQTTSVWDVPLTDPAVRDAFRRGGIHALLGVRLPPTRRLRGVMYIGLAETSAITAREVRRLESLGEHLMVHLDNAWLHADLRQHIDQLESERELRERFVSILAHDLRGPLTAAKMSAQVLIAHPERLDERRELAVKIDRNIERTDRMIRDLLDANRIRAGQSLPLRIDKCDLGIVAREVYEELVATFGERFSLKAEHRVMGFWSAEELRRSLWNLAANAVKYGATDKPISITVRRTAAGAQASVHNWGNPISGDEQRHLFRPFSRTHAAHVGGQKGWGLGLTLVHGCLDAHGGRVRVESSQETGTTFALELPPDARAFQRRPDEPRASAEFPSRPTMH